MNFDDSELIVHVLAVQRIQGRTLASARYAESSVFSIVSDSAVTCDFLGTT